MEIKKVTDFDLNKTNPFAEETIAKMGNVLVSKKVLGANKDEGAILKAVDNNGEVLGGTAFIREKVVDQEQFAKFFFAGFKAFYDLKPATIRLFGFIINLLKPNLDSFNFYLDDCKEATGMSVASIYRGLGELCSHSIIARGRTEYEYYINPMVVFNGDRITFATTYINKNHPNYETKRKHLRGTIDIMKQDKRLPTLEEALEDENYDVNNPS